MSSKFLSEKSLYIIILLGLLTTINSGLLSQASPAQNSAKANKTRVTFKPPENGQPKVTVGGASRDQGKCQEDPQELEPYLTPVIPVKYQGLTTQEYPTILVYLPNTSAQKAFFSLREISSDPNNQQHYQTILSLPKQPGIISVTLPKDALKLEIGKTYQWSFVIMCNNNLRPDSPVVEGTIERVALSSSLRDQLQNTVGLEQVALYGQAGLWYDAISTLAQLRQADPNNLEFTNIWQELLNSEWVGLNAIANKPLIQ